MDTRNNKVKHRNDRTGTGGAARMCAAAMLGLACCLLPAAAAELGLAEAVRLALASNPAVRVQAAQIDVALGQQAQAAGRFDLLLGSGLSYSKALSVPIGTGPQSTVFSTGYQIGATQQLRSGASVGLALDASARQESPGTPAQPSGSQAKLGVTLALPLLKGRGAAEVGAAEEAARLTVLANRHLLRDRAAQMLQQTLSAYWAYCIRGALLNVAISGEERSRDLLNSNQKLVDASEKPRGDLVLLKADLADKMAARQAAALALNDAKMALGRLLGLDAFAIGRLAAPADALPASVELPTEFAAQSAALQADALARRPDLRALALQIEAAERQNAAARHRLLPALDLEVGLSYTKTTESRQHFAFLDDSGRQPAGPSVAARLNFQFPLQNQVARGAVLERSALLTQLQIQQRDLLTGVASGIDSALQTLASSAAQLKVAQQALALYEQAVNQEIVKQKNGIATLIDVINIETRYVNARVNFLQTQLAYANAIARLRFETGTLLPGTIDAGAQTDSFALDVDELAGLGPLSKQLAVPH